MKLHFLAYNFFGQLRYLATKVSAKKGTLLLVAHSNELISFVILYITCYCVNQRRKSLTKQVGLVFCCKRLLWYRVVDPTKNMRLGKLLLCTILFSQVRVRRSPFKFQSTRTWPACHSLYTKVYFVTFLIDHWNHWSNPCTLPFDGFLNTWKF